MQHSIISLVHSVYAELRIRKNMIVLLFLSVWFFIECVFFVKHQEPLDENELLQLSKKRTREYIHKHYQFKKVVVTVNKRFKASLNPNGKWYETEIELSLFPSYVAALLKGKKHEWVVLAIEKDGVVLGFYANKGRDKRSVSFNCSLSEIMEKCKRQGCSTIMRFHNHPNGNPNYETHLLASKQDKLSAKSCAERVIHSYNWLDFVCERGDFIKFFEQYSPAFFPESARIEQIRAENNISKWGNYILHRELGIFH